jgi:hypothetical protein
MLFQPGTASGKMLQDLGTVRRPKKLIPRALNRGVMIFAFALFALAPLALGQSPADKISREIEKSTKVLEAIPKSNQELERIRPYVAGLLDSAGKALKAGHLYVALEQLERASTILAGGQATLHQPGDQQDAADDFESQWRRTDAELKTFEQRYSESDKTPAPLAILAMAQTDWVRMRVLYNAGRGFADATSPSEGFFYLGQAKGSAAFAEFCRSLKFLKVHAPPSLHSLGPEIRLLEEKIMTVYKPPHSIEHHAEFVRLHSALKEAGDLESAHLYAGALYKYLDALQLFAALESPAPGSDRADDLQERLSQARERLANANTDQSIAQTFVERADLALDAGSSEADRVKGMQTAQAILDLVLPAYSAALEKEQPLAAPPAHAIKVTLVRWPYT